MFSMTSSFPSFCLSGFDLCLFSDYGFISAEPDHTCFDLSYGFGPHFLDGHK